MEALHLPADDDGQNTQYYSLIDLRAFEKKQYGKDFAKWLSENRTDLDILDDLAAKKGVVLMYGPGFGAPEGTVRISLANLNVGDYAEIADRIIELMDEYYQEYEEEMAADQAA